MSSFLSVRFSPVPTWLEPTLLAVPEGSLKYPAIASLTGLLVFNNQSTINKAIMAVTKSA